jgi:hypothetical protein
VVFLSLALLLLPLMSTHAKEALPDVKADSKEKFMPVADHVREQMQPGGRFEFVTAEERATIGKDLDGMQALFDKFGTVDAMDLNTKIQLYNQQSEVNGILTKRDGDREICEYAAPTGTQIPKTTCRRYADIERNRRDTDVFKEKLNHVVIDPKLLGH